MKMQLASVLCLAMFSFMISSVHAENESVLDKFLGSPLLALTVLIIIVVIAFIYRKIRK